MAGEQIAPGLLGQLAAFHGFAGDVVAPHGRDDNDVFAAHGRRELGDLACRLPGGLPLVQSAVERGEDRSRGDFQVALLELLGQPRRVVRQVAVGAKFDPLVAGLGHLIEEPLPRGLLGVISEPDAPGVRRGADDQFVLSHDSNVFLLGPRRQGYLAELARRGRRCGLVGREVVRGTRGVGGLGPA
ncbi:hypothetical protein D9M72_529990 [compost metagenome]